MGVRRLEKVGGEMHTRDTKGTAEQGDLHLSMLFKGQGSEMLQSVQ